MTRLTDEMRREAAIGAGAADARDALIQRAVSAAKAAHPVVSEWLALRQGDWQLETPTTIVAPAAWPEEPEAPVEIRITLQPMGTGQKLEVCMAAPRETQLLLRRLLR